MLTGTYLLPLPSPHTLLLTTNTEEPRVACQSVSVSFVCVLSHVFTRNLKCGVPQQTRASLPPYLEPYLPPFPSDQIASTNAWNRRFLVLTRP